MSERPLWLHWQPIRFNPWLGVTLLAMWILYMVLSIAPYWTANNWDLMKAFFAPMQAGHTSGPTMIELVLFLPLAAGLVWFTYFSKSTLVKDHDRFTVFLMLCGAGGGWIVTFVRFFSW